MMHGWKTSAFRPSVLAFACVLATAQPGGGQAAECSHGPIAGNCRDIRMIESIKESGRKLTSERSIVWVEADYLSEDVSRRLHRRIDKGIVEVETFLGVAFPSNIYKQKRIEYFVHSRRAPSHTITGYQPRKYLHPIVFLSFAKRQRTPYLHETVHIIGWDWNALWLKEGLAVHLNDRLGGFPTFPNLGTPVDELTRDLLREGQHTALEALDLIGKNGVPRFHNRRVRRTFYIFAGSYVGYLLKNTSVAKIMQIYSADDTSGSISRVTGKSAGAWKKEWIASVQ